MDSEVEMQLSLSKKNKAVSYCAYDPHMIRSFVFAFAKDLVVTWYGSFEPRHGETGVLPMRKQRHRSGPLFSLH